MSEKATDRCGWRRAAGPRSPMPMQDAADVILVDPKDYLELPMVVPRLMVPAGARSFPTVNSCPRSSSFKDG